MEIVLKNVKNALKLGSMDVFKVIFMVIVVLSVIFGGLMFLCWIKLIDFLPYNSLVGFIILTTACLITYVLDCKVN